MTREEEELRQKLADAAAAAAIKDADMLLGITPAPPPFDWTIKAHDEAYELLGREERSRISGFQLLEENGVRFGRFLLARGCDGN